MDPREQLRTRVLEAALQLVAERGWSADVLAAAAEACGKDSSYGWRLFPGGARDAITLWNKRLDQQMLEALPAPGDLRVRDRITLAVKTRIQLLAPYRATAKETTRYLKRPSRIPDAMRIVYQTVSEIWYYAGDTSTDYNFYTKRGLLAWVYTSTSLYWLNDTSEGSAKTWEFLDRRIQEVLTLPQYFKFPWKRHGKSPAS